MGSGSDLGSCAAQEIRAMRLHGDTRLFGLSSESRSPGLLCRGRFYRWVGSMGRCT